MRIFVDENVPRGVVVALRAAGHDVAWGCEFDTGATDVARTEWAFRNGRVILTEDKDFPALVFSRHMPVIGLVMIDLHGFRRTTKIARIVSALSQMQNDAVGLMSVIGPSEIRRRPLP